MIGLTDLGDGLNHRDNVNQKVFDSRQNDYFICLQSMDCSMSDTKSLLSWPHLSFESSESVHEIKVNNKHIKSCHTIYNKICK